jgi:hypothetical protein
LLRDEPLGQPEVVATDRLVWPSLFDIDGAPPAPAWTGANCGYAADEVDALRARWGRRLNESHLFGSIGEALAFREVADARVPEHAPFFVYRLYLVGDATR